MGFQFVDLVKDLAVAQAGPGTDPDAAKAEAIEDRTLRRRIAGLAWIPGAMSVLFLAGWANSVIVGVAGFVILFVALWQYAERGDRITALIRSRRPTS
jgi:hypothetical protein